MAVEIKNPSVEITSLPYPLQGVLKGGQACVLSTAYATLIAACPSLTAAFLVKDLGSGYSGPNDNSTFGLVAGASADLTVDDLTVSDAAAVGGDLTVAGAAAVTGDIATNGTLEVAGTTSLADNLDVDGDVAVTGALGLDGNAATQMAFTAAPTGGATVDAEARAFIAALRTFLLARGDMAAS